MRQSKLSVIIITGFAMFSMFFGAGNIVFPLGLGRLAQGENGYAILGLLITAVGVPFLGLISMTLFNGNYKHFFERIGTIPGFALSVAIMGLIGPFGAIPRCISLAYATIAIYFPNLSLPIFSIFSCILIYLLTFKRTRILDILGYFLTPLLLGSLAIIIYKGFFNSPAMPQADHTAPDIFLKGLTEGYQTMDLLGAFFFSSVVLSCLEDQVPTNDAKYYGRMIKLTLKASLIGAGLLALTYVGFSYTAAFNSQQLADVPKDQLLGQVALLILGPAGGVVAGIAAALACLTTAIALTAVFAEFLHKDISADKINYQTCLMATLIVSFFVSTLHFNGIAKFLAPILEICYPALIVLSILNIAHKLFHFHPVKVPVFSVFLLTLIGWILL